MGFEKIQIRGRESGKAHETDLSAEPTGAQAPPRLPVTHGNQEWPSGLGTPSGKRAQAPFSLRLSHQPPAFFFRVRRFLCVWGLPVQLSFGRFCDQGKGFAPG
jgi:hypothetical protein